jgi:hypothetical protein
VACLGGDNWWRRWHWTGLLGGRRGCLRHGGWLTDEGHLVGNGLGATTRPGADGCRDRRWQRLDLGKQLRRANAGWCWQRRDGSIVIDSHNRVTLKRLRQASSS